MTNLSPTAARDSYILHVPSRKVLRSLNLGNVGIIAVEVATFDSKKCALDWMVCFSDIPILLEHLSWH